jgi:very-short-patch-repair endonuclease
MPYVADRSDSWATACTSPGTSPTRSSSADEARWFGFKGVRQLREQIRFADPRAESPRESWLRLQLHDAGFPATDLQVAVDRGPGREPYRLDLAIPEVMVAFEYDGAEWHPPEQEAADNERRAFIRRQGWTLIVVRRGDLERPQRLVDAVGMFITPVRAPRRGSGLRTGFVPAAAA